MGEIQDGGKEEKQEAFFFFSYLCIVFKILMNNYNYFNSIILEKFYKNKILNYAINCGQHPIRLMFKSYLFLWTFTLE